MLNNLLDSRGVPKEGAKFTTFPRCRVTSKDSQKKELTVYMSQAGRKPSQALRTQNETSKKAIAIPGRERVNNWWVWTCKERDDVKFYFPLLTRYSRQRFWRVNYGKNSHPSLASASSLRIPSAGSEWKWRTQLWYWPEFGKGFLKINFRASLVAQWLRICLLMQGTRVRALVWEDPTCHRAAGPVSHNCWACASGACAPQQERPQ